ncbi:hypothetical protein FHS56_000341 [Thermonema lapsum]|uniref:Nitrogen fixation protein FixH n=1 Tax=Thermonema lapsum TaxID=28195 RepID=A0A846MN31_9BACT|nr:FixH family protein [Thermonema lapsum]NIK72855.1 hypothetical protein [Thermonema lapsum]
MRISWGYKIALLLGGFIAFMSYLVFICVAQDDIHLVDKNYYKEELAYQARIDAITRTRALEQQPVVEYHKTAKKLYIKLPYSGIQEGKIKLYRPSDARLDKEVPIRQDQQEYELDMSGLLPGYWEVKMQWSMDGQSYYMEQKLHL